MIKIIYGSKGTGKTKAIIDMANASAMENSGDTVFITDTSRYIHDIKHQIRFTNSKESKICSEDGLIGFVQGIISANYDIENMFIDGAARMVNKNLDEMESFFKRLEDVSLKTEVSFILTVSADLDQIPDFIKKYIEV